MEWTKQIKSLDGKRAENVRSNSSSSFVLYATLARGLERQPWMTRAVEQGSERGVDLSGMTGHVSCFVVHGLQHGLGHLLHRLSYAEICQYLFRTALQIGLATCYDKAQIDSNSPR